MNHHHRVLQALFILPAGWQALQLEFFGDSIVEAWRGSQHGQPSVRCQEGPAIFKAHFGPEYEAHAWGIAGIGFVNN